MNDVGDLGRRVSERRHQLGLSREEVARRARMHPAYLAMLERSPSAQPTRAALLRLSAALDTTIEALAGGGALAAPGRTAGNGRGDLGILESHECERLIASGGVGRVVFDEARGPVALPVNYKMLGRDVVFRTASHGPVAAAVAAGTVSFEVDNIDDALSEGWSVVVSGDAHVVADPTERASMERLDVRPWAGGDREAYVRLVPRTITGRRIRRG